MYLTLPNGKKKKRKKSAYVLIRPIYNGRARAAPSLRRGMLISQRTLAKSPAAESVNSRQLTGLIQLHPRATHHFMELCDSSKTMRRRESLHRCSASRDWDSHHACGDVLWRPCNGCTFSPRCTSLHILLVADFTLVIYSCLVSSVRLLLLLPLVHILLFCK